MFDHISVRITSKGIELALIHQQAIICCVAVVRFSLRRITPYASVVAPRRLTSDGLLVIRNAPKLTDSGKES
jgi:hypothetical protein